MNNNKLVTILVTAVTTTLITGTIFGTITWYSLSRNISNTQNNTSLDNSNISNFYSSSLDSMFLLPKSKSFNLFETKDGISINFGKQSDQALVTFSDTKDANDYVKKYSNVNGQDLGNKVKVNTEVLGSNVKKFDFDYTQAISSNLLPSSYYSNKTILVKSLNNGLDLVIEYNGNNINSYLDDFLYLVNNVEVKPENIVERFVRYGFINDSFFVDLDKTLWIHKPSPQTNLYLEFIYNNNFEKDIFKSVESKLNIIYYVPNIKSVNHPDTLKNEAEKNFNYYKDQKYKDSKVITPLSKTNISSKDAYQATLSYKNESNESYFFDYVIINTGNDFYVELEFFYPSKDSNAYKEFQNVLKSLNFKD